MYGCWILVRWMLDFGCMDGRWILSDCMNVGFWLSKRCTLVVRARELVV